MPFDPSFPPPHAPLLSAAFREQFTGLQTNIQAKAYEDDCVGRLLTSARNPAGMELLEVNTADVATLAAKLNELITALQR